MASRKIEAVSELPEDAIQIKQFKGKQYDELFYSPSEDKFYQGQPKYKALNINVEGHIRVKTSDDKQVKVTASALKEYISDNKANSV